MTKLVLPKVLRIFKFHLLAQGTKPKFFFFFPRNIHYRARLKGPPFHFFFGIVRLFFEICFPLKIHLSFFLSFATNNFNFKNLSDCEANYSHILSCVQIYFNLKLSVSEIERLQFFPKAKYLSLAKILHVLTYSRLLLKALIRSWLHKPF